MPGIRHHNAMALLPNCHESGACNGIKGIKVAVFLQQGCFHVVVRGMIPWYNDGMKADDIRRQALLGEDSKREFKRQADNSDSLAAEMVALANAGGGAIYIGVADDGSVPGISSREVQDTNQRISNAASQMIRSPLAVRTENVAMENGRIVIVITVPNGIDKPYFDKKGVIWLKAGSDKRRINSSEELGRLLQEAHKFHADEMPTKAGLDKLDEIMFRNFLRDAYGMEYPSSPAGVVRLLQNMNLATDDGHLNLAGVLMFAEQPEFIVSQFAVKAVHYHGNHIHSSYYKDTEDFAGPISRIFKDSLAFIMRNLHKVQAGRGVNAPGTPEIPAAVFEELLVNALVHRDYMVSAAIRLFVYDDRVEIVSPGHLPDNLTVEKIRTGISNIRNPILVSHMAKGLLPYHGLGSGIMRALRNWPHIDFVNNYDKCLFVARVNRPPLHEADSVQESLAPYDVQGPGESAKIPAAGGRLADDILRLCQGRATITIPDMSARLGTPQRTVARHIQRLQKDGLLRRIGGRKMGRWDVRGGGV